MLTYVTSYIVYLYYCLVFFCNNTVIVSKFISSMLLTSGNKLLQRNSFMFTKHYGGLHKNYLRTEKRLSVNTFEKLS